MFITDKKQLEQFSDAKRFWQGIPGLEITKKGRIFSAFYSGGYNEGVDNFVLLTYSDDDGKTFSSPIAVAYAQGKRCFDGVVFIDPLHRLWFVWAYADAQGENEGVYGVICDNPDGETLAWGEPFFIGKYVMMNKPTVLSSGEWLFPIAVWRSDWKIPGKWADTSKDTKGAFVYQSVDNGKTFEKIGGVDVAGSTFDEHMILELQDKSLMMLVRTDYGIGVSYSFDKGKTWSQGENSGILSPSSRFFIRRLQSGRVLLVNHFHFKERNNLTALLSEDDGKTWKYSLLLDERTGVSYPDGVQTENGYIYITYDRERGDFNGKIEDLQTQPPCAREILFAKFTESDIIAGKIVDTESKLKQIISKIDGKFRP